MFCKILFSVLFLCALNALALPPAHAAPNAILTVNTANDTDDGHCNALGTGTGNKDCTLREAINAANATNGVHETIEFDIPEGFAEGKCSPFDHTCSIALASYLPVLTDAVTIDGYTQTDASANTQDVGNNAKLRIVLRGESIAQGSYGLVLGHANNTTVGNHTIKGLNLRGFSEAVQINSDGNVIEGNFIGTDYTGTSAAPNSVGIYVYGGLNNRIGGTYAAARNVISGNSNDGIQIFATKTQVQGNYIGTNAQGLAAIPNESDGIWLAGVKSKVGGKGALARNLISGNYVGIVARTRSDHEKVQGNWIGVGADGTTALPNTLGILAMDMTPENSLGLLVTKNRIANSTAQGIVVGVQQNGNNNLFNNITITKNSIYDNGELGIDLKQDGITANDNGDGDTGPNGLQNYPILKSAIAGNGKTTINGILNSQKNTTYHLEFFVSPTCDGSGNGEGSKYIAFKDVTTNSKGKAKFNMVYPKFVLTGNAITATATEIVNGKLANTSEFSQCVTVTA